MYHRSVLNSLYSLGNPNGLPASAFPVLASQAHAIVPAFEDIFYKEQRDFFG